MAVLTHTSSKLASSARKCRRSQLVCKATRKTIVAASSGRRPSAVTSAAATTEAPTQQQQQQQQEQRVASVSVNLGTAVEQVTVPLSDPNSRLVQAEIDFPLGLVIERVNDEPVVTEVAEGSAAESAGCRVGDVVRATSAMTMQMVYPTMNIMFGGVGRPALVKILVPTSKAPFPKVLDAVRSNSTAQGGDGSISLILEQRCDAAAANSSSSSSNEEWNAEGHVAAVGDDSAEEDGSAFDPKIFE